MPDNSTKDSNQADSRFRIAIWVLVCSGIGVTLLSVIVIVGAWNSPKFQDITQMVFSAVLPLLATWVGTVLAYYYSRENFESANQNVRDMVKLTSSEKLKAVKVSDVMIPLKDITAFRFTSQKTAATTSLIDDLIDCLEKNRRNRLPILDDNDIPKFVIHRSIIDRFIVEESKPPKSNANIAAITLQNLLDTSSSEVQKFLKVTFGTVKEVETLADVKREMDRENGRLDVLVTKDGTANSAVVGWVTNLIIAEHAKV
ncbi:MAG: hypothetical protein U0236_15595 [Nitrospira sp.]